MCMNQPHSWSYLWGAGGSWTCSWSFRALPWLHRHLQPVGLTIIFKASLSCYLLDRLSLFLWGRLSHGLAANQVSDFQKVSFFSICLYGLHWCFVLPFMLHRGTLFNVVINPKAGLKPGVFSEAWRAAGKSEAPTVPGDNLAGGGKTNPLYTEVKYLSWSKRTDGIRQKSGSNVT